MYYDLNIPYIVNRIELQRTLSFVAELGYDTVALDFAITGKVPGEIVSQIPSPLPFAFPSRLNVLRRCTLHLSDPSQNHRISQIYSAYDILALRPTNEKSLLQACQGLECDIISLDLGTRFEFYFKYKMLANAIQRGIKIEICYGAGMLNADGGASRRNLISNATQLIRASRGRGLIISSEARSALACRAPADVVNMSVMWGLGQERGMEAVTREARSAVVQAEMKRRSFRGVIDVVYGGQKPERPITEETKAKGKQAKGKRKAGDMQSQSFKGNISPKPVSKREQKKQAKMAKVENDKVQEPGLEQSPKDVSVPDDISLRMPGVRGPAVNGISG